MKPQDLLVPRLSRLLFEHDPLRTCCVQNDAFDEYDRVALSLAERMLAGEAPEPAMRAALVEWFGEELVANASMAALNRALCDLLASRPLGSRKEPSNE
ncbi:MAG: hypothetical protein WEB57_00540 [Pseudohongiellaceae bacterium]